MPQQQQAIGESRVATYTISGTTASSAGTNVFGSTVTGLEKYRSLDIVGSLIGATGGVLDLYLQTSVDHGTTWVDYIHFTQLAAGAGAAVRRVTVSRAAQSNTASCITGATNAAVAPSIVTVGTGTSVALAASTVVGGEFGDRIRCVAVSGASTSAGAAITFFILGKS